MNDSTGTENTGVGLVGAGKMGSAFARRLLEHGFSVSVWNRSPGPAEALGADGATVHFSLESLVTSQDVVIVSLWGDDLAREVTLKRVIPLMSPRQTLIEMSTLSPAMYETLERAAHEKRVPFVAAPVLGNPDAVRNGALVVLPGGAVSALDRVRPVLDALGNVMPMTSAKASGYLKLANNSVLGIVATALGELIGMCEQAGVERDIAIRSLVGAFERVSQSKLKALLDDDTTPRFSLGGLLKDLRLSQGAAHALSLPMPMLDMVADEAQRAENAGLGDRDYIALALDRIQPVSSSTR